MMFKRRQEKSAGQPAVTKVVADVAAHNRSPSVIEVSDIADLQSRSGGNVNGQMISGWCLLSAHFGGRSIASLPVSEGDTVRATAQVVLMEAGTSEHESKFMFGPVFLDANNQVVQWWNSFDRPSSEPSEIKVETVAPAGAVAVRLGMHGTWNANGETADYVVGFASARMEKL